MIELHNIDCMDFMANVPDQYYDLAIVDPPYGIGEKGAKYWDHASSMHRVTRSQSI